MPFYYIILMPFYYISCQSQPEICWLWHVCYMASPSVYNGYLVAIMLSSKDLPVGVAGVWLNCISNILLFSGCHLIPYNLKSFCFYSRITLEFGVLTFISDFMTHFHTWYIYLFMKMYMSLFMMFSFYHFFSPRNIDGKGCLAYFNMSVGCKH